MYFVVDMGSNTIRLKAYEYKDNKLVPIFDKKSFGRLANYVDDEGNMTKEGIQVCIETLNSFKDLIKNFQIDEFLVFATASLRNISNTDEVINLILLETGIRIDVISGVDEAYYDYIGATNQITYNDGLMVDIGGGSTELVFIKNGEIENKVSFPMGSLNTYNKYVRGIIPNKEEIKAIQKNVKKTLENLNIDIKNISTICGIGGSIRAFLKLKNTINKTKSNIITNDEIMNLSYYKEDAEKWMMDILQIIPDRIFTLTVGIIILKSILKYYGATSIIVSQSGVREGYVYNYLKEKNTNELHTK